MVYQLILVRKKVNSAMVIRSPAKAKILWRLALDTAAGLTKILFSFWLALGLRTHSHCAIEKKHLTEPRMATNKDDQVFASLVIEADKVERVKNRVVRLP